jgi:hypothetical protein
MTEQSIVRHVRFKHEGPARQYAREVAAHGDSAFVGNGGNPKDPIGDIHVVHSASLDNLISWVQGFKRNTPLVRWTDAF